MEKQMHQHDPMVKKCRHQQGPVLEQPEMRNPGRIVFVESEVSL